MAITVTDRISPNSNGTDQSSYTTATASPSANAVLLLVEWSSRSGSNPPTPTVTGWSLTWTTLSTSTVGSSGKRLSVHSAVTTTAPGSGSVTIDFGVTLEYCTWHLVEFTGDVDASSVANAWVQGDSGGSSDIGAGSGTSASLPSLSAFGDATNNLCVICYNNSATLSAWESGAWASIGTEHQGSHEDTTYTGSGYRVGEDTSPTYTISSSTFWNGWRGELKYQLAVTRDQDGFRWYEDDNSESTSTAREAEDTDTKVVRGENVRLRIQINMTGDAPSEQYKLQAKRSTEPASEWTDIA